MVQVLQYPISVLNFSRQGVWWNHFNMDGKLQGLSMILYHEVDQHFDILVSRESALATQVKIKSLRNYHYNFDSF